VARVANKQAVNDVDCDWRPTATFDSLHARAAMLARLRQFMAARGILEVETPALVRRAVTDPQLHSLAVQFPDAESPEFLHTSPEYAMKRLLASGSGDIYQVCKVFRGREQSALHNTEFTLLEWYRLGYCMSGLIDEVDLLAAELLAPRSLAPTRRTTYADALREHAGVDALAGSMASLRERALTAGLAWESARSADRDTLLDFLVAVVVGPNLGKSGLEFLTHYPASQAALARLAADDSRVALRFELYWQGVELANGFEELADAAEQARRFEHDRQVRTQRALPAHAADERLLAALQHGMPACAGVALGFDRLVMLALGKSRLTEVISFTHERA
jgi:lysyl-tRNA synthetase class 2